MPRLLYLSSIPLYPDYFGGGELSTHILLDKLVREGWEVEAFCYKNPENLNYVDRFLNRLKKKNRFELDERLSYRIWRGQFNSPKGQSALLKHINAVRPDVVMGHYYAEKHDLKILEKVSQMKIPTYCFIHIAEPLLRKRGRLPASIQYIANSFFTAEILREKGCQDYLIIPPFMDREHCYAAIRNPQYILFINPVPEKGVSVLIEVARSLPKEKFCVIKSNWSFTSYSDDNIHLAQLKKLPNVQILDLQQNMATVYQSAKILFLPSQFLETFSRSILEAHMNSIPVVASRRGGIPYTLGRGGVLVDNIAGIEDYVQSLTKLCTDKTYYDQLSKWAYENSLRAEFDPEQNFQKILSCLKKDLKNE